ncbi:hypothetical protein [Marinimicrobium sp. LS-A18]|uniref:hypothetical protein n=1 Tax=Marinimicrobium sp. LS-A18 TaxID=1381596 RepID=UPI000463AD56|nr:hypothetical protein [Marinimicrobium sp. LS-A18]
MTDGRAQRSALRWSAVMLALLALYLIPELIFNAQLVAIAGSRASDHESLRGIELFGRAVSGLGVTLLVADGWIRGRRAQGTLRPLGWLALCAVLVWPLVFFGQKGLVDRWLIEPSSAEQRQRAVISQLLRSSLADNTIAIDGLPVNGEAPPSAAEMTFLTVFGALAYADPELIRQVEGQRGTIARQLVRNRAYRDFEQHYQRYRQLRDEVREGYSAYLEDYGRYRQALQSVPERAGALWAQAEAQVEAGWLEYQQAQAQVDQRAADLAEQMGPSLFEYFDRRNQCSSDGCRSRLDQRYQRQMERSPVGYVEPDYWLIETEVSTSENLVKTGLMAALTAGVSLVAQGVNKAAGGDGGWRNKRYQYTRDPDHYRARMRGLLEPAFIEQSGYPSTLTRASEFRGQVVTGRKVVQWAKDEGLSLPEDWTFSDQGAFDRAARETVRARIQAQWTAQSDGLEPGLSWPAFQQHPRIQGHIQQAMGGYYIEGARADWNNREFKERVLDPVVDREARRLVAEVEAQTATFADGGEHEVLAKRALRATLVPPISMTLSLALVLITLVKLPVNAWALWRQRRGLPSAGSAGQRLALRGALVVAVLMLPVGLGALGVGNPYVEENRATHYFLTQVRHHSHPVAELALNWALRAQPVLLPVGLTFERHLPLYHGFNASLAPGLDAWDASLQGVSERYQTLKNRGVPQ